MGIFNTKYETITQSAVATIIARDSRIKGTLSLECDIHLEGYVEGTVTTSKSFIIGKEGCFKGMVKANHVIVSGFLEGECESDVVEILSGGKVTGCIHSADLSIEKGGHFVGESHVVNRDTVMPILQDQSIPEHDELTEEVND